MCHFHAWKKSVRKNCINPIKSRPYSKRPIVCMQNIKSCFLLIWIIMERRRKSQVLLHYSAKIFCAKDVLITIITMSRPSWTLLRSRRRRLYEGGKLYLPSISAVQLRLSVQGWEDYLSTQNHSRLLYSNCHILPEVASDGDHEEVVGEVE